MKSYNKIFVFNKENNLQAYVEIDSVDNSIENQYYLSGRELTKLNTFDFGQDVEITKTKITFEEDCELWYFNLDGDSCCRVRRKGAIDIKPPIEHSRISILDEDIIGTYTINKSLVEDWIKKL